MKAYCTFCGSQFASTAWPKHCQSCDRVTWKNPIPVINVIQPVYSAMIDKCGLAIARRAIQPCSGEWALVGGYVDMQDDCLISAARREFNEETNLNVKGNGKMVHSQLNSQGNMIVTVVMDQAMSLAEFQLGIPCKENHELGILWAPEDRQLCFPIHNLVVARWFNGEYD